jgi:hypothetical protein
MSLQYTEEQIADLYIESSQSTTIRLIYEITQWDVRDAHMATAISIMLNQLHKRRRISKLRILVYLFIICCLESHFFYVFKEKWYVFDEDEREIRKQLKIALCIHLFIFIILMFIATLFNLGIGGILPISYIIVLPAVYIIFTIYLAMRVLRPIKDLINHVEK